MTITGVLKSFRKTFSFLKFLLFFNAIIEIKCYNIFIGTFVKFGQTSLVCQSLKGQMLSGNCSLWTVSLFYPLFKTLIIICLTVSISSGFDTAINKVSENSVALSIIGLFSLNSILFLSKK